MKHRDNPATDHEAARAIGIVPTGDLADRGEPGAYGRLGDVLDTLPSPVYCLAGNHDRQDAIRACLPRPNVHVEPAVHIGNRLMLFLDTNANGRELGADGTYHDRDDRVHAAAQPALTPIEDDRARAILTASRADHVFVQPHQPPLPRTAPNAKGEDFPTIRAIGAGHLHGELSGEFEGRPVYVSPSSFYGIDYADMTLDGPGYRTYTLHPDGRVDTEPRTAVGPITEAVRGRPLPRHFTALMTGEEIQALSDTEFEERFGEARGARRA
ncbi:metallophosphoesterase [Embleya hyalina]|uniref:3',5'-cyclic adenosine monophosphate phosphodiesterase CpdA n=1 Tax=Embleya hyalina TaxID=516124 RepID=A0A401YN16_9ACTN|nr:metallophosphoesterase [Embleya hyalina]GCD95988.1 3',5'-cyclic adenosine monophosphate phosphodiesterase CpdA [Embleya hyalina]